MATQPVDPDREYRLIEQLELRVASANTDEKFAAIVHKFLAALLQKLGSPTARNRNLAIKVCQHILQRLKIDSSITLPTGLLLKTFREEHSALVKQFTLVFIEQGLTRIRDAEKVHMLPDLLHLATPETVDVGTADNKMWSIAFDFMLNTLSDWQIPDHRAHEDADLKQSFNLSSSQSAILSKQLSSFLLYDPKDDRTFQNVDPEHLSVFEKNLKIRHHIVLSIARFIFLSIFDDMDRFVPATILSVDPHGQASMVADTMFKQCNFDLESGESVDALFMLFDTGKPKLQTRCLHLLARSRKSTQRAEKIVEIVEKQLFTDAAGLEGLKLRAALFAYLNWAIRIGDSLEGVNQKLQTILKEFIELQGWPSMLAVSASENDLRAKAYEAIGLLSTIKSANHAQHQNVSVDLITWLFTSLRCDTGKDIRSSIDEALSRVLGAVTVNGDEDRQRLTELLLWNVGAKIGDDDPVYFFPTKNSTRYLAVRFANKCLRFSDVNARYIDLIALSFDDRREIAEEALRGLDPYWHTSNSLPPIENESGLHAEYPSLIAFVQGILEVEYKVSNIRESASSLSATVTFCRNLLVTEALYGSSLDVRSESEWQTKIQALVTSNTIARQAIKKFIAAYEAGIMVILLENCLFGVSKGLFDCADIALELLAMTPAATLLQLRPDVIGWCREGLRSDVVQLQASRILGILGSLSAEGLNILDDSLTKASAWEGSIGQDAVVIKGHLFAATYIGTRSSLRHSTMDIDQRIKKLLSLTIQIMTRSKDKALIHAAYISIGQISLCVSADRIEEENLVPLREKLIADAKKEDEIAVAAFGRLINVSSTVVTGEDWKKLFEPLFTLHEIRKAEFHFAVGEAMAVAALGFHSLSTMTEFDVEAAIPGSGNHPDVFKFILDQCITQARTTKPSQKKAAAIWLLCLIQYCADADLLKEHLRSCQAAFTTLLSDRDEIVQETGSRGLGLVYEKGDHQLRDDLVRDLLQTFTGGGAKMSGTVTEETQLFESGALPTEGGQSVTTYKDIVSLATEMGDPSLVYRFMNLASNNAIWSSRAAFGRFGLSGVLADSTYLTENKKFYPKLFRYRFDPNPNVQRSMDDIWKALVKDSNKVIEENFQLIMDDLLKSVVSGKEWRAREASCAAIADLIQGREIEKYEEYLDTIWNVAFKVLDDVKETVRIAAMKLCRALTNMLIQNLEVGDGTTKRASVMLSHAIPFLLRQMEHGIGREVQQYAVITILEVIKKSPLRSLHSFAPGILETLVLSLSSLEHESINYLHLNADKYGLTADKLDQMRVSSISSSPVTDAIERCLDSMASVDNTDNARDKDGDEKMLEGATSATPAMQDGMKRLEKAFKSAIGLPSRVGLSRVMVTLVVRHHTSFRPFADRFARLTRKYILDRNATISVSFSMALAYLIRLASEKEVHETSRYTQKLYFESEELSHRAVAGEIVQAISKASNDTFMRFASNFLPFAFIGRQDLDEDVRARFDAAWKDNVGGSRALNLYLPEIVENIRIHIGSGLWPIKQACCLASADLVSSMESSEPYTSKEAQLLWPVMREALGGKTWEGKEKVISAYPKFVRKARTLWPDHDKELQGVAMREAKRKNMAYRTHAIEALGDFAVARPDLDLGTEIFALLTEIADELADEDNAMEVDGDGTSHERLVEQNRVAVMKCIFGTLSTASNSAILDQAIALVKVVRDKRSATVDLETYDGARRLITQATTTDVPSLDGRRRHDTDADDGQARTGRDDLLAAFLPRLVLATFSEDSNRHTSDNEKVRKARINLATALADSPLLTATTRETLVPILKEWLRLERSRLLQADLDKTIRSMESPSLARSGE